LILIVFSIILIILIYTYIFFKEKKITNKQKKKSFEKFFNSIKLLETHIGKKLHILIFSKYTHNLNKRI